MSENLIERYLIDMREIRGTGSSVAETSFYPALERLLSGIGKSLSPKVRCVINITNRGAGLPDGGLFSADQFRHKRSNEDNKDNPFLIQNPSRGVLEAKPPSKDIQLVVGSEQVERYWKCYGMVLVTNFRSFVLLGKGPIGQPCVLESFTLADSESEFWRLTVHPRQTVARHGEQMLEYLKRVLLHNAPLTAPQDVAAILASYAHDARLRIEKADLPALSSLRHALEDALGLHFETEKGEHFFRSTLIQTLFYGVFSAWVLWARQRDAKTSENIEFASALRKSATPYAVADGFDWRSAHWLLRVPMLRALFVQVADPSRLGSLGLIEVLDWTAATLNRVDRVEFFKSFDEGHPVQYFYEPFLQAFDPELRKELGVWYTPEEIVHYQVERIDAVLRSEIGLADGLADPRVIVLDPCCGTGAYLRAVLRRIAATLHDKGGDALVANDLKKAAMERVFGFEILPAPFVIAHLQIGLELETLGAPLSNLVDPPERAGIYLTNALTGWEPPKERPKQIAFPGFDEERDAAGKVKQEKPILVILGNPPYNAFAGVSPDEENDLVEPYKKGLISEWGIKKFNLDDLYIRFFRLAERRIAEIGGRGVVSFISNYSYLSDPSFVVARQRFLKGFNTIWLDCMNGDSRETGKLTPDGKPDPSVFSTEWNKQGIRVGTVVGLFVKRGQLHEQDAAVLFRHFWGAAKRTDLLASLEKQDFDSQYETTNPRKDNRWSFRPSNVASAYLSWPRLVDLCGNNILQGMDEDRANALIDINDAVLSERIQKYFNPSVDWGTFKAMGTGLSRESAAFDPEKTRKKALQAESFDPSKIRKYVYRPYDGRWCYYSGVPNVWKRHRPDLWRQSQHRNHFLLSRAAQVTSPEGVPFLFTHNLMARDCMRGHACAIPFSLSTGHNAKDENVLPGLENDVKKITANLSSAARTYLTNLGLSDPDTDQNTAELIWYHALAVGYSPAYLAENADGIQQDWPRIPLPQAKQILLASAALGRKVAALLDDEAQVPGVTVGRIRSDLKNIAVFQKLDGKPANLESGDLDLTAGWGHTGKDGVTMPGKGKMIYRDDSSSNVFLNDKAYWSNIPQKVWEYTIGGYQIIKKWLSYREKPLIGRSLTPDEVRYVTEISRRLMALISLQTSLDDNYREIVASLSISEQAFK